MICLDLAHFHCFGSDPMASKTALKQPLILLHALLNICHLFIMLSLQKKKAFEHLLSYHFNLRLRRLRHQGSKPLLAWWVRMLTIRISVPIEEENEEEYEE